MNSIEEIKLDPVLEDIFNQQLLENKHKRLSDIKKLRSNSMKTEAESDLYKELFEEFISIFIAVKRKLRIEKSEYNQQILEKLFELPLNKWKSKLRSVPEPISSAR